MKSNIFLGGAAVLLAALTGCSNEAPLGNGVAEQDEVRYLRVNLMNPTGTRAIEFETGTSEENAVNTVIMDFYDAAGNFVYRATPDKIEWQSKTGNPTPNVGVIGEAVVQIDIEKEQNLPAYVMCYLNPVDWGNVNNKGEITDKNTNMKDLRLVPRYNYVNGNGKFAMNNSCYYGDDIVTGEEDVKISGTPILESQLLTSKPNFPVPEKDKDGNVVKDKDGNIVYADSSSDTEVVDIYVERYAAKVNFTAETKKQTLPYTEGGKGIYPYVGVTPVQTGGSTATNIDYSLDFNAEAWTINADAPSMYAVKNFATEIGAGVPTLVDINNYLGGWGSNDPTMVTWNDPSNHRSYWSCSPAFFASQFPQVSDQIADIAHEEDKAHENDENYEEKDNGQGQAVGPYALRYYSYNQICGKNGNGINGFSADTHGVLPVKYALENTMGKPAFASLNPKAAVPSVLLVGNYSVTYNKVAIKEGTTFYIYNKGLYFEESPVGIENTPIENAVLIKDKFIENQEILYVKSGNEYKLLSSNDAENIVDNLVVKHPDKSVRGENLVPHRFVTLQLTDNVPDGIYYRPNGAGSYVAVTKDNRNIVNTLLWQQSGVAYAYTEGKCYFSMPIFHLGMTENEKDRPLSEDGVLDWKNLRVGDMGLVRNHVYKLSVDAITGLATGIENLNYPIVPPMDKDEYWIKYRIKILNWRIVPEQKGIIL